MSRGKGELGRCHDIGNDCGYYYYSRLTRSMVSVGSCTKVAIGVVLSHMSSLPLFRSRESFSLPHYEERRTR